MAEPARSGTATLPAHPAVLVVIPTLNEARHIDGVLHALSQDLPAHAQVDFVVADGGSTDGTPEAVQRIAARRPDVHLMQNPQRIQSAAVNRAARQHGEGVDVLIRCDAHAAYPRGYIRDLLATLQRTGADSVVVPMDSMGDTCVQKAVAWVSDTPMGSGGSAHRGGRRSGYVDHGHHAAFRMDTFRRTGGYDETFTHNEDAEYDCRQRALGARVYLDADIRLGYHPRSTLRALWRQYFGYGRGRSRTVRRHRGSMRLRQLAVPMHLLLCLAPLLGGPLVAALLPAWLPVLLPALLLWPLLYAGAVAATSLALTLRHRSPCGLWAGPAAATMHFAWAFGFFWGLVSQREAPWDASRVHPLWGGPAPAAGRPS